MRNWFSTLGCVLGILSCSQLAWGVQQPDDTELELSLRFQTETAAGSDRFHTLTRREIWDPAKTAIIVCDVWDLHHCLNAVRRVEEFAPRLDQVLKNARKRGLTIIHAPSDCMPAYQTHPARQRAKATPAADDVPADISNWCSRIPKEAMANYPLDQSDGGEDDDPQEHAEWVKKLETMGRNPKMPWTRQSDLIVIDSDKDYISDRGDEVWNILHDRKIENVILTGVHTNMCVLGRPFGLRQLVKNGKRVVLMRDMTDSMYNPNMWPFVSHFTGTDLIIGHIERYVCPTITSAQLIGGKPFRFSGDDRPHVAIVIAEDEYDTHRTLPEFAKQFLNADFRVTLIYADAAERNDIPGLEALETADIGIFSIRRRVLPKSQMSIVRRFVEAKKPLIGIRTSSHAFALRNGKPTSNHVSWPEFDQQVFGGNYTGHHGNNLQPAIKLATDQAQHELLTGIDTNAFRSSGSLYKTSPVSVTATILLSGEIDSHAPEPVAWTFRRAGGGRSFYTSLGHPSDFESPIFQRLLVNAVYWAADKPIPQTLNSSDSSFRDRWVTRAVPDDWTIRPNVRLKQGEMIWYRCLVRLGLSAEQANKRLRIVHDSKIAVWFNGHALALSNDGSPQEYSVDNAFGRYNDLNLLVIRIGPRNDARSLSQAPEFLVGQKRIDLSGRWQFRVGNDTMHKRLALPPKFAASTDIIFQ